MADTSTREAEQATPDPEQPEPDRTDRAADRTDLAAHRTDLDADRSEPGSDRPQPIGPDAARRFDAGRHEWLIAGLASLALALLMIWLLPPFLQWGISAGAVPHHIADPLRTIIGDAADPTGQAWLLAWGGHALLHDPGNLWNTNAFYPETYGLALNDSMLGYAPFGFFGNGPADAMLRYNVVYVLAFALATVGAYALSRQLGANRIGSAVAGVAFAYAPWRYGHDGHLNILSSGGIVLALAMLARGHGWSLTRGYRAERTRPGWALGGWLVAAWQISIGFGIGLPFFYVMALVCVVAVIGWLVRGRPRLGRRLVLMDLAGGVVFAAVSGYFALAYLKLRDLHPESARSWDYVALFSPTPRGFLVAPRTSLPWGDLHEAARTALGTASNEKTLLCGLVLYALAIGGLALSIWPAHTRFLLAAGVLIGLSFSLGTNGPIFKLLWLYVPGFDGSRTPGRLIIWPTILLGVLAAGFVSALARRSWHAARPGYGRIAVLAATLPLLLAVTAEGASKMDHVPIAPEPAAMAQARSPLMVLPSDEGNDLNVMLWSTDRFPTMVNGASSLNTPEHQQLRDLMAQFPSRPAVDRLRQLGIRSVVVVRDRIGGTPYENVLNASPDGLGVTRTDVGPDVLFTID